MELKIKETISVFVAIAFISVAAGGDYYYAEMNQAHYVRQLKQKNKTMLRKLSASMQKEPDQFSKKDSAEMKSVVH